MATGKNTGKTAASGPANSHVVEVAASASPTEVVSAIVASASSRERGSNPNRLLIAGFLFVFIFASIIYFREEIYAYTKDVHKYPILSTVEATQVKTYLGSNWTFGVGADKVHAVPIDAPAKTAAASSASAAGAAAAATTAAGGGMGAKTAAASSATAASGGAAAKAAAAPSATAAGGGAAAKTGAASSATAAGEGAVKDAAGAATKAVGNGTAAAGAAAKEAVQQVAKDVIKRLLL